MLDTYQSVTPTAASNHTIYFDVVGDVAGNTSLLEGVVTQVQPIQIVEFQLLKEKVCLLMVMDICSI